MNWEGVKNILVIRPDNMGDLLMSVPALRALKETFHCRITLLTSSMAAPMAGFLPEVDDVIPCNLPWVKAAHYTDASFNDLLATLFQRNFDAAVIFTVCSQNPLPSAMIAYLAGIPRRLAYCRENPYALLTHWMPDAEPYTFIRHQVERDLALVAGVGAVTSNDLLSFSLPAHSWGQARCKLEGVGVNLLQPWIILHAPVSEARRQFDLDTWMAAGRLLHDELKVQLLLTGAAEDEALVSVLAEGTGAGAFNLAGRLALDEFMAAVAHAPLVVSVNTSTIHIAAAAGRPVLALYACTNPQHTPWKTRSEVLYFPVASGLESKNEVVRYLQRYFEGMADVPVTPQHILRAARRLLE